jgi:hypothetical protein
MFLVPTLEDYTRNNRPTGPRRYDSEQFEINQAISKCGIQWGEDKDKDTDFTNSFAQQPLNGFPIGHRRPRLSGDDHDHRQEDLPLPKIPVKR